MSRENLLMVADSERDANMLYAVRMFVPGPFIYLRINGKCHVVLSDQEIDRAREQARHCRVISLTQCLKTLRQQGVKHPGIAHVVRHVLQSHRLKQVSVPDNFPLGLARDLSRLKVRVKLKEGPFFPERALKSAEEVKKISAALMMAEVGLAEGIQALKISRIGRQRRLIYHSVPLTADKLRAIINTAILQAGGQAARTIVAGGRQGCELHEQGHGVLRAHEPIILDVGPRSQKTGYFGDIARTVVKGRASEPLRKLYHTVERGQEIALEHARSRTNGSTVHQQIQEFFKQEGYQTGRRGGRLLGFIHGAGHGLGLEIHEAPHLGPNSSDTLQRGHVVTVEPGLYYTELGGVRLEDVVLITGNGPRNLTKFEKMLEV